MAGRISLADRNSKAFLACVVCALKKGTPTGVRDALLFSAGGGVDAAGCLAVGFVVDVVATVVGGSSGSSSTFANRQLSEWGPMPRVIMRSVCAGECEGKGEGECEGKGGAFESEPKSVERRSNSCFGAFDCAKCTVSGAVSCVFLERSPPNSNSATPWNWMWPAIDAIKSWDGRGSSED